MSPSASFLLSFVPVCVIALGWVMYMATCRTEDFLRLMKADEDRRKSQHERMTKSAGGAVKAGMAIVKMFKR